ncbi:hypothetical protein, partial [Klebsiella pneumoniae]|uniref:hypothetical protein n=1 Tax=Klebsiella pneumoniae TaxID=573 RepID=UPI003B98476E
TDVTTSTTTTTTTTTSASTSAPDSASGEKSPQATDDAAKKESTTADASAPVKGDSKDAPIQTKAINDDMPKISAASRLISLTNMPDSKVVC